MKPKFFITIITILFLFNISKAAEVDAWAINSTSLVSGRLYLASSGATSVTYNVTLDRSSGETGFTVQFALATKNASGGIVLVSSVSTATDADFQSGSLYANKQVTVSVSNSTVLNSTVYLVTDPTGKSNFAFFAGSYNVTNSSTPPSGAVYWNGSTNSVVYVSQSELTNATVLHTSSNPLITNNQSFTSAGGTTRLILQADGNLVLYQLSTGKALWASGTNNNKAKYLYFQPDGNLVLRAADHSTVIWASNIYAISNVQNAQYAIFVVQDDGNLVMMIDSQYEPAPRPGFDQILGDTGTGNFTSSPHNGKIN